MDVSYLIQFNSKIMDSNWKQLESIKFESNLDGGCARDHWLSPWATAPISDAAVHVILVGGMK